MSYQPPYSITPTILKQVADISEAIGRLSALREIDSALHLRRANRIRTIQGSLAIEGNTLSEPQITAIVEGKRSIIRRCETAPPAPTARPLLSLCWLPLPRRCGRLPQHRRKCG